MNERKIEIYLDTSVPNALLDHTKPERQRETIEFWKRLSNYQVYISDFVLKEIRQTPQQIRRDELLKLVEPFEVLSSEREEIKTLTQNYLLSDTIAIVEDAVHVAIAVVYKIGILTSWNYRHLVKLKTKRAVNALNLLNGYNTIEIVDPSML